MHPIRSRISIPIQIFLIIFYIIFILLLKQIYDNYQKHQRFDKYSDMVQEVNKALELVEKQSRRSALDHQQYEGFIFNHNVKVSLNSRTKDVTLKPP